MPKREVIEPKKGAILSPAVRFGNLVFTSGVIGVDADGKPAPDVRSQAELCMKQLEKTLADAGTSFANVVKVLAFVVDLSERPLFNEVYTRYFPDDAPARSCVAVSDLGEGIRLELECVACIPE